MIGTRQMSGSVAMRFRKCVIASSPSSMPSSMLTSMMLRAALDLLPRDGQRLLEIAGEDELGELGRAGDVGALADDDEVVSGRSVSGSSPLRHSGRGSRSLRPAAARGGQSAHRFGDGLDVRGRGAAAAADDVEPALLGPIADLRRQRLRRLGKAGGRERIGQAGVRDSADKDRRDAGKVPR